MNTESKIPVTGAARDAARKDSTKLLSLLTLAAGAAAMPQTAQGDIIYQASNVTVGFDPGDASSYNFSLPGTSVFGVHRVTRTVGTAAASTQYRELAVGEFGGASAVVQTNGGLVAPRNANEAWDIGLGLYLYALAAQSYRYRVAGVTTDSKFRPAAGYDHKYFAFRFNGSSPLYGWAQVTLEVGGPNGPRLTIYGYAYDDTGAALPIPEPGSLSVLALGALAFGARGLRSWRRKQDGAGPS